VDLTRNLIQRMNIGDSLTIQKNVVRDEHASHYGG
jgi:hypothetical protein